MGAQCGRLCCRPCRKQLTIKQRVNNIFSLAPIQVTEAYCKSKALKISEYLNDRKSKIPHCVNEFKTIISSLTTESSAESERLCLITLYSLRHLSEQLKEFLPITYILIYKTMQVPYFTTLKVQIYETLKAITSAYPDEDISALEDIMSELIKYLSDPKNVTRHEIKLLSSILTPLHQKIAGNHFFDWKKLLNLVLDRIDSNEDIDEELVLLTMFSKILLEIKPIQEIFILYLIEYLHNNSAWSRRAKVIFSAVLEGNKEYFIDQSSALFKIIIESAKKRKKSDVVEIVDTLVLIIENSETINTWYYSDTFASVVAKIMTNSNIAGSQLLELWVLKSDVQSFFKFYTDIIFNPAVNSIHELILRECRARFELELSKSRCALHFLQPLLEITYDLISRLKASFSQFLLKNLSYMISKVSTQILFKNFEVSSICGLFFKALSSPEAALETFKHLLKIAVSIISQKSPEHISIVLSLAVKLSDLMADGNSFYISLLIWSILKASGIAYEIPSLTKFVNKSAEKYLKIEPYRSSLLSNSEFSLILQHQKTIFSKHSNTSISLNKSIFDIGGLIDFKVDLKHFDENERDEEYLGYYHTDTEFSSVSSFDIQERVIDLQDIRPEIASDYHTVLINQEEQDNMILGKIARLSI